MSEIPVHECSCGSKTCGAVRHIEDLGHDVDELRREVRQCERHHAEDLRRLWIKMAVVTAALVTLLPSGWSCLLGVF